MTVEGLQRGLRMLDISKRGRTDVWISVHREGTVNLM